jgi:hypothetical protein
VERGIYRPVTKLTLDLIERARDQFRQALGDAGKEPVVVAEMTLRNLLSENRVDHADFLARVDILGALGFTVMVSNYSRHYRLAAHLRQYTSEPVVFALGIPALRKLFDEDYYTDLDGGILESFGRLFKSGVQLYIYPTQGRDGGPMITADTVELEPHLRHLYAHLYERGLIRPIGNVTGDYLHITPGEVLEQLQHGDPAWEKACPPRVVELIRKRGYFGCPKQV